MKTQEVADYFGGKKKLAAALGVSPSAVSMWGETIPETRQYQIQVISKGKFKVDQKPDAHPAA
ncbi:DNA-binding transcriptional regulator Cro [Pseudomonas linyingensis]|uniref:DNA-binding transcriptional regulator Cro n=1 Tax=Pseudomonas linyingensis TaxID=915471 RepID=A0A1H6Z9K1_9PSED|nr:Cro/CI family transcriptional regulator [Pseudomonas linyingensis]SEJ46352.1 DNA-binding transcriptional regulator Cro [Pseudomonas linyingensis]